MAVAEDSQQLFLYIRILLDTISVHRYNEYGDGNES